ncbi:MAG: hypothetical protein OEW39_04470 [Deltaproteobacteria bacterium]|nr:hypothetical protein [Deltaproteobacteria bacterium]
MTLECLDGKRLSARTQSCKFIVLMVGMGLVLSLGGAAPAGAESNALVRFYYSNWISGSVTRSPFDPVGGHEGEPLQPLVKGEAEIILFKRVGISYTRQKVGRNFEEGGLEVEEYSLQTFSNLTLYLMASSHNAFNLFGGAGGGQGDYRLYLNRFEKVDPLYENIPLFRRFVGMEYTLERIGFRLELTRIEGAKLDGSRQVSMDQRLGYFSVYIPFN